MRLGATRAAGRIARGGAVAGTVLLGAALSACSGPSAADEVRELLPDGADYGLTSFVCGEGRAIGSTFTGPEDDAYVALCWEGSATEGIDALADDLHADVLGATLGEDVSGPACARSASSGSASVACRAALVTRGDSQVLVRTLVVFADLEGLLAALPGDPTDAEIQDAIDNAAVEVLVGTEPVDSD